MNKAILGAFAISSAFATAATAGDSYDVIVSLRSAGGSYDSKTDTQHEGITRYTALLRHQDTGALVQCNFLRVAAAREAIAERGYDIEQVMVDALDNGGLGLADALRNGTHGNPRDRGSCYPYESAWVPGTYPPLGMIRISFGNNDETHAGYGGTVIMDPVREQRLQRAFMPQFNKPGSALPVLREDWGHTIFYSYILKAGACENAGDFSVAERIDRAYADKKPVTGVPLRRNCPELQ